MASPLEPFIDWMVAPGPPNWVFVAALLTAPHLWAKKIKKRMTPLLDQVLPLKKPE